MIKLLVLVLLVGLSMVFADDAQCKANCRATDDCSKVPPDMKKCDACLDKCDKRRSVPIKRETKAECDRKCSETTACNSGTAKALECSQCYDNCKEDKRRSVPIKREVPDMGDKPFKREVPHMGDKPFKREVPDMGDKPFKRETKAECDRKCAESTACVSGAAKAVECAQCYTNCSGDK